MILALVYYRCPLLCNQVLTGLTRSLKPLPLEAGVDFDVVTVSIDPEETPELAARKKAGYLERYDRPGSRGGLALPDRRQGVDRRALRGGRVPATSTTRRTKQYRPRGGDRGPDARRAGRAATSTASSTRPRNWRCDLTGGLRARSARRSRSCFCSATTTTRRPASTRSRSSTAPRPRDSHGAGAGRLSLRDVPARASGRPGDEPRPEARRRRPFPARALI